MDEEIEEYRDRIERRCNERRQPKNDRREIPKTPMPPLWDWFLITDLLLLAAIGVAMYLDK